MATIRERTMIWLSDNSPGRFSVTKLAADLGLERRQALNALHGLKKTGLGDQLDRVAAGMWDYHPPDIIRRQEGVPDYKYDDGFKPTRTFTRGFVGSFRVLARAGNVYLVQGVMDGEAVEAYAMLEPIDGPIERLSEQAEKAGLPETEARP